MILISHQTLKILVALLVAVFDCSVKSVSSNSLRYKFFSLSGISFAIIMLTYKLTI